MQKKAPISFELAPVQYKSSILRQPVSCSIVTVLNYSVNVQTILIIFDNIYKWWPINEHFSLDKHI